MEKEFAFLVYTIRKLNINDPAFTRYYNILQLLLDINEYATICFISAIEDDEDLIVVSSHFAPLAGKFQSEKFIKTIEEVVERFKNSKWYQFLQQDVLEAKKAMDNYQNE